jgi:hypothetical protein
MKHTDNLRYTDEGKMKVSSDNEVRKSRWKLPPLGDSSSLTRVYTLDDLDISSASEGMIDFSVYMTDSCPTGPMSCSQICTKYNDRRDN